MEGPGFPGWNVYVAGERADWWIGINFGAAEFAAEVVTSASYIPTRPQKARTDGAPKRFGLGKGKVRVGHLPVFPKIQMDFEGNIL